MNLTPVLIKGQIIENREVAPKYLLMSLCAPEIAKNVIPGQFFHIKVADRMDILLRRPFSVFDSDESHISILYEVVGKGTLALSEKKPGEDIDILGPLGNGFTPLEAALPKARLRPLRGDLPLMGFTQSKILSQSAQKDMNDIPSVIFVGGGMGIVPLFALVKETIQAKKRGRKMNLQVLIGAQNKYKIVCEKDFIKLGLKPEISTDDGSYGAKAFVTELLKKKIKDYDAKNTIIYGCGPNAMLRELCAIIKENNIYGQISMDRHMGCGMGVCLGCVVKTTGGKYKRVCKDGPVFDADDIMWE